MMMNLSDLFIPRCGLKSHEGFICINFVFNGDDGTKIAILSWQFIVVL